MAKVNYSQYQVRLQNGPALDVTEPMSLDEFKEHISWMGENPDGWTAYQTISGWVAIPVRLITQVHRFTQPGD